MFECEDCHGSYKESEISLIVCEKCDKNICIKCTKFSPFPVCLFLCQGCFGAEK